MASKNKGGQLLEELVIKVNTRALKAATKDQDQLSERMQDSAAGAELLNEQLDKTNSALTEARKLSRGLANSLEGIGGNANMQDYFDGVVAAIQDVEGVLGELGADFQNYAKIAQKGNDEVVVSLEKLLDPLRSVDKQTGKTAKGFTKFNTEMGKTEKESTKASKGLEGLNRTTKNLTRGFSDIAKIAGPLPLIYATIAANVYALTAAYEQLAAGDRLNRLEKINKVIGAEQGVAISQLAQTMQEATGFAIGYENAMQKAAQASAYGFSVDQVEQFTLAARRASVALGVDLDDALNRIIRGVSKLEIELLDELGITVRLTEAYTTYQRQMNLSATALTGYQKQQAYANAVIAESTKRFGYLGDAIKATPWERLAAGIDQSVKSGQKWVQEFLEPAAEQLQKIMEQDRLTKVQDGIREISIAQSEAAGKGNVLQIASLQLGVLKDIQNTREEITKRTEHYNSLYEKSRKVSGVQALNLIKQANEEKMGILQLNKVLQEQEQNLRKIAQATGLYAGSAQGATQQVNQLAEQFRELQQLKKSLPEEQSIFDATLRRQKAPTESIQSQWETAIKGYHVYQKLIEQTQKIDTPEAREQNKNYITEQENLLIQSGVESIGQLNQQWAKAVVSAEVYNSTAFNSEKVSQDIQKNLQFAQGNSQQLAQNKQSIAEIDEKLSSNLFIDEKGQQRRLISEQEELDLRTKRVDLERENLNLSQQQNEVYATQASTMADIQNTQQLLNNQDPLKQQVQLLDKKIQAQQQLNQANQGLSKPEERQQNEKELLDLILARRDALQQIAERDVQIQGTTREIAKLEYVLNNQGKERNADSLQELEFLNSKSQVLEYSLKTAKEYGATQEKLLAIEVEQKQNQLDILSAKEQMLLDQAQINQDEVTRRGQEMGLTELEILTEQVSVKQEFIKQLEKEGATQKTLIEQQTELRDLELQRSNAKMAETSKYANTVFGAVQGQGAMPSISRPGETGPQQLKEQELATASSAMANQFSELSQYDPQMASLTQNVSNLGLQFYEMGKGQQTGQQVAAAAMSTVAQMLNASSSQTVQGIDAQIQAEKERDGTSKESAEKIKKLEAEKAQQQKKAATQQIIMQTAMGITQALATLPPPYSYVMAGTTAMIGMQALQAQQSASTIPSVSEGDTPSLSLGERDNRVDVANQASAGELAYVQGDQGTGSINNFKPRAVGNSAPARTSVLLGENGPEVASFDQAATITPQHKTGGQNASSNVTYVIQAMDSESFESFLNKNGGILTGQVENNLNSRGKSLMS